MSVGTETTKTPGIRDEFAALREMIVDVQGSIAQLRAMLAAPQQPSEARTAYSVEEVATLLGKSTYTVREWCRHGQINATKRSADRRGGAGLWSISSAELTRIKNDGLLPIDPRRNTL